MKLLNRLIVVCLFWTVAADVWAQSSQHEQRQAMKEAQREAKMQLQAEREQRRDQRIEVKREQRALIQPLAAPPPPPAAVVPAPNRPFLNLSPSNGQATGGPRRLTPEERQQLRDQIRDARRMYQQGQ